VTGWQSPGYHHRPFYGVTPTRPARQLTPASKAQLESQWKALEAQVKTYIDTVGKKIEQQAGDIPGNRRRSNEGLERSGR
jgi:hypothetical protein